MYIAWLTQNGEGCDYTIGCGQALHVLDAKTLEEALAEVGEKVRETVCREWSGRYDTITVYAVGAIHVVPVAQLYKGEEERRAAVAAEEAAQEESALRGTEGQVWGGGE